MYKKDSQYIVNRDNLNSIMESKNFSDKSVAEEMATFLGCSIPSAAVRIGALRAGKTISTDIIFLSTLETVLEVAKGVLTGKHVNKHELERIVRVKKKAANLIKSEIQKRLTLNPATSSINISRKLLEQILTLL